MSDRTCSIEGCGRPVEGGHGWCAMHHRRWTRHGDPLGGRTPVGSGLRFLVEALLMKPGMDECIIWPFHTSSNGYGKVLINGHWSSAHVVVCLLAHGERPPGMLACHDCGSHENKLCVNPRHLRWDTPKGNQADRWRFRSS